MQKTQTWRCGSYHPEKWGTCQTAGKSGAAHLLLGGVSSPWTFWWSCDKLLERMDEILKMNQIEDKDKIVAGQKIKLWE